MLTKEKKQNKRLISFLLICSLLLSGCNDTINKSTLSETTTAITTLPTTEEITQETTLQTTESTKNPYIGVSDEKSGKTSDISKNEKVCNDYYEIEVLDCDYAEKVLPSKPSGLYRYYDDEIDKTYLIVSISYKNLKNKKVYCSEVLNVDVTIDNVYSYYGFWTVEKSDGSNFENADFTSIDPFETKKLLYIVSIPTEIIFNSKEIKIRKDMDIYNLLEI